MLTATAQKFTEYYGTFSDELKYNAGKVPWNFADVAMPIPFELVLNRVGFEDALALLAIVEEHEGAIRYFACWCASEFLLPFYTGNGWASSGLWDEIRATERYVAGKISKDAYLSLPVVKDSHRSLKKFPAYAAAQGTVLECLEALFHAPDALTGQSVSENDTAAIAFLKKCRLKYRVVPANMPNDMSQPMSKEAVGEKMTAEFRDLCRLEGRYAQFAPKPSPQKGP